MPKNNVYKRASKPVKKEAIEKKAIAIAIEMKKDGFYAAQIRRFTKLSLEEIEKL